MKKYIEKSLNSYMCVPIVFTIGFLGWFWQLDFVTIPLLALYTLAVFIFSQDVKGIFPVVISVPFYITNIETVSHFIIYGGSIGCFLIGAITFIIKQFVKKSSMKKGKLFIGFIFATVACVIGGVVGYFNIINFLVIFAFCLIMYFMYWISINFCTNFKFFLNYTFITLGVFLFVQLLIGYIVSDNTSFLSAITWKCVIQIGLQNINVVAIYFMLAMMATFQLAYKHRYDYLLVLLALFFAICTYFTYSRMGTLICFIFMVISLIYIIVKSDNKAKFFWLGIASLILLEVVLFIFGNQIMMLFDWHFSLGTSGNGRDVLWPWCIEKFQNSPIFGVGFVNDTNVPAQTNPTTIILAHNTILQYLTSCGIVGTLLMTVFFVKKYLVCFRTFTNFKLFNLLSILIIEFSGITDQSPTMDVFIIIITIALVSLSENDEPKNESDKINFKNIKWYKKKTKTV